MSLTPNQLRIARESLTDVFTLEGDAVVVGAVRTFTNPSSPFYGKGQCAKVNGALHFDKWMPVADLEASRALLELEKADTNGTR